MLQLILFFLVASVEGTLPACTACPADGVWSQWQDYTSCSATCGFFGSKVQNRSCNSWVKGCPCVGPYSRVVPCVPVVCPKAPICKTGYTKYVNSATGQSLCGNATNANNYEAPTCTMTKVYDDCPCPNGGLWSAWTNSGTCNATCGLCGFVTQKRTCRSTSYGCPCSGISTRSLACPKAPCATGTPCCKSYPKVNNLITGAAQCGLQLAPDQVLPLPTCPKTTTTKQTTAKATTTSGKPACQSCAQNLNTLETTDGTMTFTYSIDSTTHCLVANWSCSNPETDMYFYTDNVQNIEIGCDQIVPSTSAMFFKCQSDKTWSLGSSNNIQKIACMNLGSCGTTPTTTPTTTTTAPPACTCDTFVQLNLNLTGTTTSPFVAVPAGVNDPSKCTTSSAPIGCQDPYDGQVVNRYQLFDMSGNVVYDSGPYCAGDAINHIYTCDCSTVPAASGNPNYPTCAGTYAPYFACYNTGTDPTMCAAYSTTTTTTTTPTTTPTTTKPPCQSCPQNLNTLETTDGTMTFTYSINATTQCLVADWSCSNPNTDMYFYVENAQNIEMGCDQIVPSSPDMYFKCQSNGKWSLGSTTDITHIGCLNLGSC